MIHRSDSSIHLLRIAVAFVGVALVVAWLWPTTDRVRVGTFNIETFPTSDDQVEGAFDTIESLDARLLAVQEITRPNFFEKTARQRLGEAWRFVTADADTDLKLGVLYDTETFSLERTLTHRETVVYEDGRPVLEAEFDTESQHGFEVFVVHLKAGSDGLELRKEQYAQLTDILRTHSSEQRTTLLMGDFNSTEPRDTELLRWLASHHRMRWTTRPTECTGYWIPDDACTSFKLDHIFTDAVSGPTRAFGPCRRQGCHPGKTCPVFHKKVSDHCPLRTTILY